MNKLSKGLSIALLIAIVVIFLQRCGSDCPELIIDEKVVVSHTTERDSQIVEIEVLKYKYIDVEVPKYRYYNIFDTTYILTFMDEDSPVFFDDDFDDLISESRIYEDSITDDTVSIHYKIKIYGPLEGISLGYKVHKGYLITKTEIIETEVTKKIKHKLGIYAGLDVGGNLGELNHFTPMIELSTWKWNYNAGYNLMNNSIIFGARIRIGKKRDINLASIPN